MFSRWVAAAFLIFFFGTAGAAFAQEPAPQTTPPAQPAVRQTPPTEPKPAEEANAYTRKRELVDELMVHANWYDADSQFYRKVFLASSILVLVGSVLTSLLVAIDFANRGPVAKALVVGLPLLTGLFTTLLGQFHVQDLWKLREIGRIDALALRERVRALPTAASDAEMRGALLPYEQEKYELERRQALAFFEYLATKDDAGKTAAK